MTQINLLPWRAQKKKRLKIQFLSMLAAAVSMTFLIIILIHIFIGGIVYRQKLRNQFLSDQINQSIVESGRLESNKKSAVVIIKNLHSLMAMKAHNYLLVAALNELVKLTPASITLTLFSKKDNNIIIEGYAQSNVDVTQFIKDLTISPVFNQPVLSKIESSKNPGEIRKNFQIQVSLEGYNNEKY